MYNKINYYYYLLFVCNQDAKILIVSTRTMNKSEQNKMKNLYLSHKVRTKSNLPLTSLVGVNCCTQKENN